MPDWFQHAPHAAAVGRGADRVVADRHRLRVESRKQSGKKAEREPIPAARPGYVLQFFGTPNNGTGDFQGGLHEHLYLNNGPLGQMIAAGKGSLAEFVGDRRQADAKPASSGCSCRR